MYAHFNSCKFALTTKMTVHNHVWLSCKEPEKSLSLGLKEYFIFTGNLIMKVPVKSILYNFRICLLYINIYA